MKSNRKSPQRCSDLDGHFDRVTRLAALLPEPESIEDIDDIDSDILIMVAAEWPKAVALRKELTCIEGNRSLLRLARN
jgi:hypothetical protein